MTGFKELKTASRMKSIITSLTTDLINTMRPDTRIGSVYNINSANQVAYILFPGETIDSLVEAHYGKNMIPQVLMISQFDTLGYAAPANIVRVAGKDGSYYITDYVTGVPLIEGVASGGGSVPSGPAGGSLSGTYPNPTLGVGVVTNTEIAAAIKDPAPTTAGLRTLGTGATQAAAGNDTRLSDSRSPLSHTHSQSDIANAGSLAVPLQFDQISTPAAAASGKLKLYQKSDGKLYTIDAAGTERLLIPVADQLHQNASYDNVTLGTTGNSITGNMGSRFIPDSWYMFWCGGSAAMTYVSDNTEFHTLGRSLKINYPDTTASGQRALSTIYPLFAGSIVTLSVWAKASVAGMNVQVGMLSAPHNNPDYFGTNVQIFETSFALTTSWQKYTVQYVLPPGHTHARLATGTNNGTGVIGNTWIDDTESSAEAPTPASVQTGMIFEWPTATAPTGYLLCRGGSFQSTDHPALAAILGDTFGTHSGTTYYLPNYDGRVGVGVGTATGAAGATAKTLGQKGGEETHVQTAAELAAHVHQQQARTTVGGNFDAIAGSGAGTVFSNVLPVVSQGLSSPMNNMQPFLGIYKIIKGG